MGDDTRPDPQEDPFAPPYIPTEVFCLHCRQEYQSYLIEWVEQRLPGGRIRGHWQCPTAGCAGAGFGFDILPTDPDYEDYHGQCAWDEEDDDDWEAFDDPSWDEAALDIDIPLDPPPARPSDAGSIDEDDVGF